jgi:hypothetical protein
MELLLRDLGQDGALEAHHCADEGIDKDQQTELREVFAQAELWSSSQRTRHKIISWTGKRAPYDDRIASTESIREHR